jgi:hypothetical protein
MSLILSLWFLTITFGCSDKPKATGDSAHLYVVTDKKNWEALQETLERVFVREIRTPQVENLFHVTWVPSQEFKANATRQHLIILGILGQEGEMDRQVTGMLSAAVQEKVKEGSAYFFLRENQWSREQLVGIMSGASVEQLHDNLFANIDYLYDTFHDHIMQVTADEMFDGYEQTDLAAELLKEYGWTVRIQHDYYAKHRSSDANFVMLRRTLPNRERWLFVHWIEGGNPDDVDAAWAYKTRDRLTTKFYEGDSIEVSFTDSRDIEFLGRPATLLQGVWGNSQFITGGPFKNYSFYDEPSRRIYMIDLAAFNPAGRKEPYIRQLDVMARTFKTRHDIEKEKKEKS